MSVISLVLSGGAGTRLWPLSRSSRPKQFLPLDGSSTLFQSTLLRCSSGQFDQKPIIVASNAHRFLVAEDLMEIGMEADIILEPVPRNSCAAITAGCLAALERSSDAVVLVLAADHSIKDQVGFEKAVKEAEPLARLGKLVTFGVQPNRPATGYGYISPGSMVQGTSGFRVDEFVEKPDEATAERYVKRGYFWNSGNFMFAAEAFLDEVEKQLPDLLSFVRASYSNGHSDLDFFRLAEKDFESAESISVDYGVLEKTDNAVVVPVEHDWSDIGTWNSVWRNNDKDADENAIHGDVVIEQSSRNFVHSEKHLVALVGVEDTIVVATRDVVLVAAQSESERIKGLVDQMTKEGKAEATEALQVYRPWGNYEALDWGQKYQVKRIVIKPGGELSLQMHNKRAEHWIVVEGTPDVTVGEIQKRLEPNQSVYIPLGTVHRLANRTSTPVVLIEVQTGEYFGEDDIVRLEDRYNRGPED